MGEKRRRGHGEGSVYQRSDGRWVAVIEYPPVAGKRRRKYVYGSTRREVTTALRELQRRHSSSPRNDRQTVGAYLASWLDACQESVRPITMDRYRTAVRLHLAPYIGHVRLTRLGPEDVQTAVAAMREGGLSGNSTRLAVQVLTTALRRAQRLGLVETVATDHVLLPRHTRYIVQPWTPDEVGRFLAAARTDRFEAVYLLAIGAGLRLGEVLGLAWPFVDFTAGTARISQQLTSLGPPGTLGRPKGQDSEAIVRLPSIVVDALRRWHERQERERAMASDWLDSAELARLIMPPRGGPFSTDLVFLGPTGYPLGRRTVRRQFVLTTNAAGLSRRRFHDLRHTHATFLLSIGASMKEIQASLRHSRMSITADTYAHILPGLAEANASRMDALMRGAVAAASGAGEEG